MSTILARGGKAVAPMRPLKLTGRPVVTHPPRYSKPSEKQLDREARD
jgi:hypothetical protein